MSRLDELPADQKAALQLLLKQGKTYDELASLLRLEPNSVRERALDALDALGPDTPAGLTAERQDEISDYLLGQQSASARAATRQYLEGSAGGRAWARSVASELRPFAGDNLPDVPVESAELDEAFEAREARREARVQQDRSSRLGGILLLIGVGVALAAALVFLIGGGDDNKKNDGTSQADTPAQTTTSQTGTTSTTPGNITPEQQINMTSPNGADTVAIGYVIKGQGRRVLGILGQGFASNAKNDFYYAVWLKGDQGVVRLGFVNQAVAASGADKGKLATGADPAALTRKQDAALKATLRKALDNIYSYKQLIISRETSRNPTAPSTVVVQGPIKRPS
jgi:hypothetical protein